MPALLLLFFASLIGVLLAPAFRHVPAPVMLGISAVAAALLVVNALLPGSRVKP